ncbi:uncharacterized protein T551_00604 [Pneumocystis jirovecii RU7]|uniref:Uncharacterized protein n=1 Tax=Pneumocystis jirovecii (strain RU7) TaxID=1408657 RepID=A0A0W4ZVX4_PNEJ7|nr:uncharacterized protein T551_00604 [Pneumocystis jirovecii RU7]KTW32514.1 hypothetical protein T551_00604 [Pneumocystis jirovecii RU7]
MVLKDDISMYSLILEESITTKEKLCNLNKRNTYCKGLFTEGHTKKTYIKKCNGIKDKLKYYYHLGKTLFTGEWNARIETEDCENYGTLYIVFQKICYDTEDNILLKFIGKETLSNQPIHNEPKHKYIYTKCVDTLLEKYSTIVSPKEVIQRKQEHITGYKEKITRNNCSLLDACDYYLLLCHNKTTENLCKPIIKECSAKVDLDMDFVKNLSLGKCRSTKKENGVLSPYKAPYLTPLLTFLSSLGRSTLTLEKRCMNFIKENCMAFDGMFPNLHAYCESKQTDECKKLDKKMNTTCINLNKTFEDLGLTSTNGV